MNDIIELGSVVEETKSLPPGNSFDTALPTTTVG